MSIHQTAIVDDAASIGADVSVGPYSVIGPHTEIGDGCVIGPHVTIHSYTEMGPGCRVHAGAVLGDLPQDLAFEEHNDSYVRIGADCTMREGVTIHRGTKPGTDTRVGDGCFMMANSHLGHNVQLGKNVIMANGVLLAGYVEVGDGTVFAGNAAVHQFIKIGRLAMISGCAISKDFLPFCIAPAATLNRVAGINAIGLKRAGMSLDERKAIKSAFKTIYMSGLTFSAAADKLREEYADGPAREMADFVIASKRGVCRLRGKSEEE